MWVCVSVCQRGHDPRPPPHTHTHTHTQTHTRYEHVVVVVPEACRQQENARSYEYSSTPGTVGWLREEVLRRHTVLLRAAGVVSVRVCEWVCV